MEAIETLELNKDYGFDVRVQDGERRFAGRLRISVYPDSDSGIIRTSVPVSSGQVNSHLA